MSAVPMKARRGREISLELELTVGCQPSDVFWELNCGPLHVLSTAEPSL